MNRTVKVSRGNVVGIGKLKVFPSNTLPFEIPMLSEEAAWEHLNELFQIDDTTRELWNAYRTSQVKYSQYGIQTDITSELLDRIEKLQNQINKLMNVKEKMEKKLAEKTEISWEYQNLRVLCEWNSRRVA